MKCVFLLPSIHQVMRSEKLLKEAGIRVDLIPVPREISSDCGVAVEISLSSEGRATQILGENRIPLLECYVRGPKGEFEKKR